MPLTRNKKHRILVVDDNPSILDNYTTILAPKRKDSLEDVETDLFGSDSATVQSEQDDCFDLTAANQGQTAYQLVQDSLATGALFSVAFVDVRMPPGWSGIETVKRLWEIDPGLEVVICTAYSDYSWNEIVHQLGRTDRYLILKKPFEAIEVRQLALSLACKSELSRAREVRVSELEHAIEERTTDLQVALECIDTVYRSRSLT